jgi:hypothetical protein
VWGIGIGRAFGRSLAEYQRSRGSVAKQPYPFVYCPRQSYSPSAASAAAASARAMSTEKLKPGDAVTTPSRPPRTFITKPMGPNASNTRIGSSVAAGSLHVSISVIHSSPAPACPTKASASREYVLSISSDLWPVTSVILIKFAPRLTALVTKPARKLWPANAEDRGLGDAGSLEP